MATCYPAPIGERSIVMSVSACVCVFVREHTFGTTLTIFTKFLCILPMASMATLQHGHGRCSVLLWRRSDTLRISGYGSRHFCNKLRLLDVAAKLRQSWLTLTRKLGPGA